MVKSVFGGIDEFEFVFDVAFIVLLLEGLNDFSVHFFIVFLVHTLDVLFE